MDNVSGIESKELYISNIMDMNSNDPLVQSILNYTAGRIDKGIFISIKPDINISDFYYATNKADSMINILDNNSDDRVLIVNTIPIELKTSNMDISFINKVISIYEYLGFRELELNEDYTVMIYMNSTGIRLFNLTLNRKEYDYGK